MSPPVKEHFDSDFDKEFFLGRSFASQREDGLAILHFRRAKALASTKQKAQKAHLYSLYSYLQKRELMEGLRLFSRDQVALTSLQASSDKGESWNLVRHDTLATAAQMSLNQMATSPNHYSLYNTIHQTLEKDLLQPSNAQQQVRSQKLLESVEVAFLLQQGAGPKAEQIKQYLDLQPSTKYRNLLEEALIFGKNNYHSPDTARLLNALLPGAGYYYVGQKSTALTSLCLNILFTAAAVHFFEKNEIAAALITTSLELGWYIGGINGAGMAAIELNEKKWREFCEKHMEKEKVWPIFQLQTQF